MCRLLPIRSDKAVLIMLIKNHPHLLNKATSTNFLPQGWPSILLAPVEGGTLVLQLADIGHLRHRLHLSDKALQGYAFLIVNFPK